MKRVVKILAVFVLLLVFVGCGKKATTDTYTQSVMDGAEVQIIVEHEGDKVTKVSAKATFNNKKLQITDENVANQVVEAFKTSSGIESPEVKYTEEETVITYTAPKKLVDGSKGFKEAEKELTDQGFTKEK